MSFTNGNSTHFHLNRCAEYESVTIRIVPYVSDTESTTFCKTRILHACEASQTYGDMIPLSNYFETNFKYFPFHVAWVELCLFQPEINISNLLVRCLTPLLYWFPTYHTCPHCTLCSPLAWATFRSFWATTHVSKEAVTLFHFTPGLGSLWFGKMFTEDSSCYVLTSNCGHWLML